MVIGGGGCSSTEKKGRQNARSGSHRSQKGLLVIMQEMGRCDSLGNATESKGNRLRVGVGGQGEIVRRANETSRGVEEYGLREKLRRL